MRQRYGKILLCCLVMHAGTVFAQTDTEPAKPVNSPAQNVFDDVGGILLEEYGGLSTVSRLDLIEKFQKRLNLVCSTVPSPCPLDKAFPVIDAEINELGDDHSYFMDKEDYADFLTRATGGDRRQFGVKLGELDKEKRVIMEIISNSAAAEAGLMRGDVLAKIDGRAYTYDDLRKAKLSGKTISLEVERQGKSFTVMIASRDSSTIDLPRLSYVGEQKDTALIRIPTFLTGGNIAQTVHNFVAKATEKGAKGIIVDLRGNTGGSLSECDLSVNAFVPDFSRVARSATGKTNLHVFGGMRLDGWINRGVVGNFKTWEGPLAVMIDKDSASCSEFFAYEVGYAKRGVLIGEETAGVSNTATHVFPTAGKSALQLTIINYAKPDGSLYPVKISPDVRHEVTESDIRSLTQGTDVMLDIAIDIIKNSFRTQ